MYEVNIMNLQEYNIRMREFLAELRELEEQQETIRRKTNEIEEAARRMRFEYVTGGDVL